MYFCARKFYFRYKLYIRNAKSRATVPREIATRQFIYFSFSRISSALIPLANSFFTRFSASFFFATSAAFWSAVAFLDSSFVSSFWADLRAVFFFFRSTFSVSMLAVMEVISAVREAMDSCFFCDLGCEVGGDLRFILAAFGSGHKCVLLSFIIYESIKSNEQLTHNTIFYSTF